MASEPGGRADKLGNEFERLWAVRHLIELVAGLATTFQLEALGDDEKGTEFWVGRPNGTREAHQCKRENGTVGKWSVADLTAKKVIRTARFQLDRAPSHCFIFASADKAGHLSDLCVRAGMCDDPAEFVAHQTTTSAGLKNEFDALCRHLGLDPDSPEGAGKVVDFLRRFRPEIVDKFRAQREVEDLASRWIYGEPWEVVAALKALLDSSIGRTLRESDVIAGLPAGARPLDLAKDPTLPSALDELRDRFDRSYRCLLIDHRSLGRKESAELATMLTADDGPRLVLIHGAGGNGKSGVVFEVVERLRLERIPCLPLRLDRDRPEHSPLEFGKSLGLPGSPAGCLAAVAGGGPGVLVLDQVDAIRWTAAHSAHAWDTCERTVEEVLRHSNLRVVVVCRSFDLNDDPRIKAWKEQSKAHVFEVGPLDNETVETVVTSSGVAPSTLDAAQRAVLRSPQGLYLWLALREGDSPPPAFRTMTDLMRRFWKATRRRLVELEIGQSETVLDALVEHMDRLGVMSAPRSVVDRWPEDAAALLSLNVLVEGPRGRLLFNHQSSLDYLTASRILRQVHAGTGTVLGWLAEDDQSLFRRGQLRQLLTLLRDDDPHGFLVTMKELLNGEQVRFHLQHLAAQLLGHFEDPADGEVDLVLGLLERRDWVVHVFSRILADSESWFDALDRRGDLQSWLEGEDVQRVNLAINMLKRVVETRGSRVEALLLDRGRERWPGRLVIAVRRTPLEKLTDGLFDAAIDIWRRGEWNAHDLVNWKSLAQASPVRCRRMLKTRIERQLDELESSIPEAANLKGDDNQLLVDLPSLANSAAVFPVEWWDSLLPCYLRVSRLLRRSRGPTLDFRAHETARSIRSVLRTVLRAAGKAMVRAEPQSFWERADSEFDQAGVVKRLIDRCTAHGTDDAADRVIRRLLRDPARFRAGRGDRGAAYRTSWKVLRRYSGLCSDEVFADLQSAVLAYWPAEERDVYRLYHARGRREEIWGQSSFDVLLCNDLGLGQYLLLSAMPSRRLSPDARDRLGVFRRKFGALKPLLSRRPRVGGGWGCSTIPADRLPRLSDRNWLAVIRGDWSNRSRTSKQMGPDRFGEVNVEMFARDLGRMASLQPARFAQLALRIPVESDPRYPIAVLNALVSRKPPNETSDDSTREEATIAQIESIIRRFAFLEETREFAMSVCRVIRERHDCDWRDDIVQLLSRLATDHADPLSGPDAVTRARNLDPEGESGVWSDVELTSINCVRGAAAGAIKALLFDQPNRLGMLQAAVDSLVDDPHAAVRAAAVGLALPIYNIDRAKAVDVFLRACEHPDDQVLTAYDLRRFLGYTILEFAETLRPLIDRMVNSKLGNVAKLGAAWAALGWVHRGHFDDIMSDRAERTRWQRVGVAEALANAVSEGHDSSDVLERLQALFDDSEKEVRDAASGVFRVASFFDRVSSAPSVADAFLGSEALDDNVDDLLHGLEEFSGSLKPYSSVICGLADRFAGPLASEARDYRTRRPLDAGQLAKVLLRLYEQSEDDRKLRRRCLDAWDVLLRQGIGHDVLQNVDA
ncbi:MAG: hypothetical protein SFX72_22400 [Isosphaeraceae bacterium]|nr:hypothetical protein [Isosphaeraceae bacterium]